MKTKRILILLGVLLLALLLPARAFAQGVDGDQVVFGGTYTLSEGEVLRGDLVVFGGVVTLQADSRIEGDVVMFGGSIEADGEVAGDLVVIGGTVRLEENAVVRGDLITPGGSTNRSEGSQVLGQIVTDVDVPLQIDIPRVFTPELPSPRFSANYNPFWSALWFLFRTLMFAGLAVLVVMFVPRQTEKAAQAVVAQPILAGGLGLLTLIVAVPIFIILSITIILIPVALLGILLLVIAGLFGWITLGLEVGQRLAGLVDREWPEAVAAGVGTLVLALIAFGIDAIPCVGWLAPFLVTSVGVGGVLLSRFGTQTYPPDAAVAAPVSPLPDVGTPEVPPPAPAPEAEAEEEPDVPDADTDAEAGES